MKKSLGFTIAQPSVPHSITCMNIQTYIVIYEKKKKDEIECFCYQTIIEKLLDYFYPIY